MIRALLLAVGLAGTAAAQPVIAPPSQPDPDIRPGAEAPPAAARHDPIRFVRTVTVEGAEVPVPMQLYLSVESPSVVLVTLAGDLGTLQERLPALLSREPDGDCETETRVEVGAVTARDRRIDLSGRAEARRFLCLGDRRVSALLSQTADVSVSLGGRVSEGCLRLQVRRARIEPDGATGALLDATGLTDRMTARLTRQIDRALAKGACIDLPPEFRAFDTVLTGGNFREIGTGRLGAVLHARMTIDAAHFIDLIEVLAAKGVLGD